MSTRSGIVAKVNNKYRLIYCHFDGYPEHNGFILKTHYNSQEKFEELLSYGDMSSLDKTIDTCKFYSKHYGEELKFKEFDSFLEIEVYCAKSWMEFLYFFDEKSNSVKGYSISNGRLLEIVI